MTSAATEVVLVNEMDEPLGVMEKLAAHQAAHLHRAFSVFLFDDNMNMLLQQRAISKYHSGGLWTNTCCSHPYPGEEVEAAAHRRLMEEMGISADLEKAFDFIYQADFDNGLIEHEFDHVFVGHFTGPIVPNPEEVEAFAYRSMADIKQEMEQQPGLFTAWFRIAFPMLEQYLASRPVIVS